MCAFCCACIMLMCMCAYAVSLKGMIMSSRGFRSRSKCTTEIEIWIFVADEQKSIHNENMRERELNICISKYKVFDRYIFCCTAFVLFVTYLTITWNHNRQKWFVRGCSSTMITHSIQIDLFKMPLTFCCHQQSENHLGIYILYYIGSK